MPRHIARGHALHAPRPSVSRYPSIRVDESRVGRGVFLRDGVLRGEPILVFRGRPIDFAGTLAKGDRECDALQVGPDLYLDLEEPGRFVNHSCEPNAGVRDGVVLVALRDLAPGDEVLFDYSTTMAENHWTLECLCGSPRCRRTVRDFHLLTPEEKLELVRQEIVPAFILVGESGAAFAAPQLSIEPDRNGQRARRRA